MGHSAMTPNLAGLHDLESVAIAPPNTWALATVALSDNPPPIDYPTSLNWITRLNWSLSALAQMVYLGYNYTSINHKNVATALLQAARGVSKSVKETMLWTIIPSRYFPCNPKRMKFLMATVIAAVGKRRVSKLIHTLTVVNTRANRGDFWRAIKVGNHNQKLVNSRFAHDARRANLYLITHNVGAVKEPVNTIRTAAPVLLRRRWQAAQKTLRIKSVKGNFSENFASVIRSDLLSSHLSDMLRILKLEKLAHEKPERIIRCAKRRMLPFDAP
jgi:hypothetical protein